MAAILAGCSSQPKGLPAGSDAGRTLAAAPAWQLTAAHLPQGQPIPALFAEGLAYQMRFADVQAVRRAARAAGVARLVIPAIDPANFQAVRELAGG